VNGDEHALIELLDRWDVRWALLTPDQAAIGLLEHFPGWRRVYGDARAVIYVRTARQAGQPSL
jgi:hypothetical protein